MGGVTKRNGILEAEQELLEKKNGRLGDDDLKNENNVTVEKVRRKDLIYGINDVPPFYITILCGIQVTQLLNGSVVPLYIEKTLCRPA